MERPAAVPPPPRRRLAGLVALAVVSGALLARGGVEPPATVPVVRAPDPPPDASEPALLGAWRALPAAPVSWVGSPRVVWAGNEALVWATRPSGGPLLLAYDPAANSWREAARPPVEARTRAIVAWTAPPAAGHRPELIVWGGLGGDGRTALGDGAAYDPATDRWRSLPDAPIAPRAAAAAAWNGSELLIAGGVGEEMRRHDGAAYDPASDSWRPIAGLPPSGRLVGHTTTHNARRLAVVAARDDRLRLLRYNHHRDHWRAEDLPLSSIGHRAVVAADQRLVVWGGRRRDEPAGIVWDGAGAVRELLTAPFPPRGFHTAVWTGEHVVVWGGFDEQGRRGDGAALDPFTGVWRPLAEAPLTPRTRSGAAWTGEELLVIGGSDAGGAATDGAAWRPDP